MRGCNRSLLCSHALGGRRHGSPVCGTHLLCESHVRGVEQELLPPIGAHQGHRLLIQPNLRHIREVKEARRRTKGSEAGLNLASWPQGRRSAAALLPMQRHKQAGHPQRGHVMGSTFSSLHLKNSLAKTLPMDREPHRNTPPCCC